MAVQPDTLPDDLTLALSSGRHRWGRLGGRVLYFRPSVPLTTSPRPSRQSGRRHGGARRDANVHGARRGRSWFRRPGRAVCFGRPDAGAGANGSGSRDHASDADGRGRAGGISRACDRPADIDQVAERSAGRSPEICRHPCGRVTGWRPSAGLQSVVLGYGITSSARRIHRPGRSRHRARDGARTVGRSRSFSSRRWRDWRAATTICSTGGSMLFSTPGVAGRRPNRVHA